MASRWAKRNLNRLATQMIYQVKRQILSTSECQRNLGKRPSGRVPSVTRSEGSRNIQPGPSSAGTLRTTAV